MTETATSGFAGEAITVAATAIGPTAATHASATTRKATRAYVTVETASIRVRYDGTAPTAAIGHLKQAGEEFVVEGSANIAALLMIRTGATSASVHITYER